MRAYQFAVKVGGQVVLSGSSLGGTGCISITINDGEGEGADTATVFLDDTGGINIMPQQNDSVEILIGRLPGGMVSKFKGKVTKVTSSGSASGGRILTVSCDSADMSGKGKEPLQKSWKNKTVKEILTDAAKEAGYKPPKLDGAIGKIKRTIEIADGESFLELSKRLAGELGGRFKMFEDQPVVVDAKGGKSASGATLPPLLVSAGVNLVSWSISPRDNRTDHKEHQAKYFDKEKGKWVVVKEKGEKSDSKATSKNAKPKATKEEAEQAAKTDKDDAKRGAGAGSISLDGETGLVSGGLIALAGARLGIDGTYTVKSCTHSINARGYNCTASVEHPQGEAGKDGR